MDIYQTVGDLVWQPEAASARAQDYAAEREAIALRHKRTRLLASALGVEVHNDFNGALWTDAPTPDDERCPFCHGFTSDAERLDSGDVGISVLIGCEYCDVWWEVAMRRID